MIHQIITMLLAGSGAPETFYERLARGERIRINPALESALQPYQQCLWDRLGALPGVWSRDSSEQQKARDDALSSCLETRNSVARAGETILSRDRKPPNSDKRREYVKMRLSNIDAGLIPIYRLTTAPPKTPSSLTVEQAVIVYDQCLARAAAKAARTDIDEDQVFGIAQSACGSTRSMLLSQTMSPGEIEPALREIDTERAMTFPERTRNLRKMLRSVQPQGNK